MYICIYVYMYICIYVHMGQRVRVIMYFSKNGGGDERANDLQGKMFVFSIKELSNCLFFTL